MLKKWILIVFIGFAGIIALTPYFFSTQVGSNLLLTTLNNQIPGIIEINDLSLGWFGPQKIGVFTLKDTSKNPILTLQDVKIDSTLFLLLLNPKEFKELKIGKGTIAVQQDSLGNTNIEAALGLKETKEPLKTPVLVSNAAFYIKKSAKDYFIKANGDTRQNSITGQFDLTIALTNNENQINLYASHFPTLLLDQTLSISNPQFSGFLMDLLGESIELTAKQDANSIQVQVSSPFIQGQAQGKITNEQLIISKEGSSLSFSIPSNHFSKPLVGRMDIQAATIPLVPDQFQEISGQFAFQLNPNTFLYDGKKYELTNFISEISADKNAKNVNVKVKLNANENNQPLTLNLNAEIPKNSAQLKAKGIQFSTDLNSAQIESKWQGNLKEYYTKIQGTLQSEMISFKDMEINIPYIPFNEILKSKQIDALQGEIKIQRPLWKSSFLEIEELSLPWNFEDNNLNIDLIGKIENKVAIRGSFRADSVKDIADAALQINLKLENFPIEGLHPLFPSLPLNRILGSRIDAGFTASRNSKGLVEGCMEMSAPKSADVFLKKINSRFTNEAHPQDITFHTETTQAIGSARFFGTFHNIFDQKGTIHLKDLSFQGNLKHFPVSVLSNIVTGDEKIADSMEAVFGCQVDAELFAELKNNEGPLSASMKGLNGQCCLNGKIENHTLLLNEDITASLKVTPQLEHAILRKYLPILGSVLSAEKPLELTVPKEGFHLPLHPITLEQLQFQNAKLELNKMQFLKDSPLGKIATLIGVQSSQFEVWFTPIYFSLQKGITTMKRTDMLVANAFPFAAWGKVDLNLHEVDMTVGIPSKTLKQAFSLDLKPDSWFQVPIKGPIQHPKIDSATTMARLSTLATTSKTGLIGNVIETANDLIADQVPPPTTQPLPWKDQLETTSPHTETPIDDLKKGAKKLLKELFK